MQQQTLLRRYVRMRLAYKNPIGFALMPLAGVSVIIAIACLVCWMFYAAVTGGI